MRAVVLVAAITLAGCGTVQPNSDIGFMKTGLAPREVVADVATVTIVPAGPAATSPNQSVSGYSCKNLLWQPAPSRDNAVNLMKRQALERGYNAIHSVTIEDDPAALVKNCWSGILAKGTAFTLATSAATTAKPADAVPAKR